MIADAVKIMVVAFFMAAVILLGMNAAIQRTACDQKWGDIDPFQIQRCEPVGLIRSEMERYRRLASDTR